MLFIYLSVAVKTPVTYSQQALRTQHGACPATADYQTTGVGGGGEPSSLALSPSPPSGENRAPIGPNCRRTGALIEGECRHPPAVAEYGTGGLF